MAIALGVAVLVVAILAFLFGNNVLHRITGRYVFRGKRRRSNGESGLPLSWNKAIETTVMRFQNQMPKYEWGASHTAYMEEWVVSKGRAVGTLTVITNTYSPNLTDRRRVVDRHEVTFDRTGDILKQRPITSGEKISFAQPFDIQGGRCPAGTTWLSFPVAFPSTPSIVVTPSSNTFRKPLLKSVSTTGFSVQMQNDQGVATDDTPFVWEARITP